MKVVVLLLFAACAPAPFLSRNVNCTQPPLEIGPARLDRCSEDGLSCRACLYQHVEHGLACYWQLERTSCRGMWDLSTYSCRVDNAEDDYEP